MPQSYPKQAARESGEGARLLARLALDRDELNQAESLAAAARQRRALTIHRLTAIGVSLADIAEVAEISRSTAAKIADRQGTLAKADR